MLDHKPRQVRNSPKKNCHRLEHKFRCMLARARVSLWRSSFYLHKHRRRRPSEPKICSRSAATIELVSCAYQKSRGFGEKKPKTAYNKLENIHTKQSTQPTRDDRRVWLGSMSKKLICGKIAGMEIRQVFEHFFTSCFSPSPTPETQTAIGFSFFPYERRISRRFFLCVRPICRLLSG